MNKMQRRSMEFAANGVEHADGDPRSGRLDEIRFLSLPRASAFSLEKLNSARRKHGQGILSLIKEYKRIMSLSLLARKVVVGWFLAVAVPAVGFAQTNFVPQGSEYGISGALPGDQVFPRLSVNSSGGYVVWQDNITDGDGLGISGRPLDSDFSPVFAPFRINGHAAGDQEKPQVALLNGGGAVFVWQSGKQSFQHIYARFLSSSNTWLTGDVMVNADTNHFQIDAAVTVLANGNVVIVYSSFDQQGTGSMQDVFGQRFTPTGQKIGGEFPINQFTLYNQRTPAVAALNNGGFMTVWVSEQERAVANLDTNRSVLCTATSSSECGHLRPAI